MQWENGQKCADILKLAGYNYGERLYNEHHEAHPDWAIYGSETASVVQSRGIYHFPLSQTVLADDDEQCSSIGNSCTGWGAKNTEECMRSGIVYGTAAMLDGMVAQIRAALGAPDAPVVATGTLPDSVRTACATDIVYRETLVLEGLYWIWKKNTRK